MKWLILGGDGQLGRAISSRLTQSNIDFYSLNHKQLDISNQADVRHAIQKANPDVVVNAAAWTDVVGAETQEAKANLANATGPLNLAIACQESAARLIHISSDYVFSGNSQIAWLESANPEPASAYGRSKALGEKLIKEAYPSGSYIIRTAWLYSHWGENFVKKMLRASLDGTNEIKVVNDQIGQPTSASDLSSQILEMITADARPGIYHGTNGGQASWFELAKTIFYLVGANSNRIKPINSIEYDAVIKRPKFAVLGHDAWRLEGIKPMRNWHEALADSIPLIFHSVQEE